MSAAPTSLQTEADERADARAVGRRRRRRRRTAVIVAAVVVVGSGAGFALAGALGGGSDAKDTKSVAPTGLATVTKGRLSARTSVSGTLGYKGGYKAINQAGGTYTKLPKVGQVIRQGKVLYRVSGKPVVFLKGSSTPLYRDLRLGMSGPDVRQLNAALADLGYGSGVSRSSRYFSWTTKDALEELQDDLNVEENGELGKSGAVFLPNDEIRVTGVTATAGTAAQNGGTVLQASSTTRQVTVALDASLQSQVKAGDKVSITLPNMKSTDGTVASVGTVAKKASSGGATISVAIKPSDPKATGGLDQAPVGVSIVTESVDDALAVPVNALLALLDGGYGVEVAGAGGARRLLPVTLGLFDGTAGTVQVSGKGLAAGQRVVVPAS